MNQNEWGDRIITIAHKERGKNKSVLFETVFRLLQRKYHLYMEHENVPQQIAEAIHGLAEGDEWKIQPKDKRKWKRGWRGLSMPQKMIFQKSANDTKIVVWHPFLAAKGAATARLYGKHRERMVQYNEYLKNCEKKGLDPNGGPVLGQRERALRIFKDEKALDGMQIEGWKTVPLTHKDFHCIPKPPPIMHKNQPLGKNPPIVVENVETYHRLVEINLDKPTWAEVILGDGRKIIGQIIELSTIIRHLGFQEVLYFGDLDTFGLEIVTRLRSRLMTETITLSLEESLYRYIIRTQLTTEAKKANKAGNFNTDWIPKDILNYLDVLVGKNLRIPQEAFIGEDIVEC